MNYFAHGREFVDRPYFLAGTAIPDWLSVVDRSVRTRARQAEAFVDDADRDLASIAGGIVQHHADDAWFHSTRGFAELSNELTVLARDALPADDGFRPRLLGHILVELLLDDALISAEPARLTAYYQALESVEPERIEAAVNRISRVPTDRLAMFIRLFCRERFLWDYSADGKLLVRLNQVMRRVKLPPLPGSFESVLSAARPKVAARAAELMTANRRN